MREPRVRCGCGKFMRYDQATRLYLCDPCLDAVYWDDVEKIKSDHRIEASR